MTIEQALSLFRAALIGRQSSDRTVENHTGVIRRLDKQFGLLDDPVVVRPKLEQYRAALQRDYDSERISASKIRCELVALRAFYAVLVEEGCYPENLATKIRSIGADPWLPRPMPMPEIERLFKVVSDPQDLAIMSLFLSGLRNVEVCRMTTDWVRYDEAEQTLVVRVLGKGRKLGDVPLHPTAAVNLGRHLLNQFAPDEQVAWLTELSQSTLLATERLVRRKLKRQRLPVFTTRGRPVHRRWVDRMFAAYRSLAGLGDEYGPHSLRHTCATELLEAGEDIRVVQEILRHSSISITQMYTQVRTGPKARAMRRLTVPVGG